jgi:hypothetical protein
LAIPRLPANPDDLLDQGWVERSHHAEVANGRRVFVNPATGDSVEFDKGRPGASGWRGRDHYHIRNRNASGSGDKYLDRAGNPAARSSERSHIVPDG